MIINHHCTTYTLCVCVCACNEIVVPPYHVTFLPVTVRASIQAEALGDHVVDVCPAVLPADALVGGQAWKGSWQVVVAGLPDNEGSAWSLHTSNGRHAPYISFTHDGFVMLATYWSVKCLRFKLNLYTLRLNVTMEQTITLK